MIQSQLIAEGFKPEQLNEIESNSKKEVKNLNETTKNASKKLNKFNAATNKTINKEASNFFNY